MTTPSLKLTFFNVAPDRESEALLVSTAASIVELDGWRLDVCRGAAFSAELPVWLEVTLGIFAADTIRTLSTTAAASLAGALQRYTRSKQVEDCAFRGTIVQVTIGRERHVVQADDSDSAQVLASLGTLAAHATAWKAVLGLGHVVQMYWTLRGGAWLPLSSLSAYAEESKQHQADWGMLTQVRAALHTLERREDRNVTDFERFDVALSFAGEDREYVEQVAGELRHTFGIKVFYDRFAEIDLWGKDLYEYLSDVYGGQRSRYCVMFISKFYVQKAWTNHERRAAQARAFSEKSEYILPVRFDDTQIPGVLPTQGYLDISRLSPSSLAQKIAEKVSAASRDNVDDKGLIRTEPFDSSATDLASGLQRSVPSFEGSSRSVLVVPYSSPSRLIKNTDLADRTRALGLSMDEAGVANLKALSGSPQRAADGLLWFEHPSGPEEPVSSFSIGVDLSICARAEVDRDGISPTGPLGIDLGFTIDQVCFTALIWQRLTSGVSGVRPARVLLRFSHVAGRFLHIFDEERWCSKPSEPCQVDEVDVWAPLHARANRSHFEDCILDVVKQCCYFFAFSPGDFPRERVRMWSRTVAE